MVKGVANVRVPVQDIERALDFYQNTLGFSLVKRDGPWAEIDASGLNIGLNAREPEGARSGGGPVITFQPEDGLDAAVEDLKGRGVEFPAEVSEHDWGRVATLGAILGVAYLSIILLSDPAYTLSDFYQDPIGSTFFGVYIIVPSLLLYVSCVLIGNAWQRRLTGRRSGTIPASPLSRTTSASTGSGTGWTPRKQAILGFVGTVIAALLTFIGAVVSAMMAGGG
jgi:catechol 2,3-dioxygenase-like lactoylglutathione lyase family enzyme